MNITPTFERSPLGSTQSKINVPYWDTVLNLYDNKKYSDVLPALLQYINPELSQKFGDVKKAPIELPHGSVTVKITQTDKEIIVEAPFLNISKSSRIPLMRMVAQLNFYPLTLVKIVLDDSDKLVFQYKGPLELCDPYKLYDIFREICINADKYDDEFIEKFKAEWIQAPRIQRYADNELEAIWTHIQSYITEAFAYIEYLESKRITDFVYDVLKSTLSKIDYYIGCQGYIRTELENGYAALDGSEPFNDRLFRGKEFLKKLQNYDKQAFLEDIYKADIFIPYKFKSNIDNVRNNFQYAHNTAKDEISRNSFMGAFYTMHCEFLRLFYYNNVEDQLADLVVEAMVNSAQKPWNEAALILKEAFDKIMDVDSYNNYLNSYKKKN